MQRAGLPFKLTNRISRFRDHSRFFYGSAANSNKKVPVLSAVAEAAAVRQIWLTRRGTSFRVARFLVGHANTRSCPGSKMSNLARGSLSPPLLSRTFVDRRTDCFRLRCRQFSFCYSENCWRFLLRLRCCPEVFAHESPWLTTVDGKHFLGKAFELRAPSTFPAPADTFWRLSKRSKNSETLGQLMWQMFIFCGFIFHRWNRRHRSRRFN